MAPSFGNLSISVYGTHNYKHESLFFFKFFYTNRRETSNWTFCISFVEMCTWSSYWTHKIAKSSFVSVMGSCLCITLLCQLVAIHSQPSWFSLGSHELSKYFVVSLNNKLVLHGSKKENSKRIVTLRSHLFFFTETGLNCLGNLEYRFVTMVMTTSWMTNCKTKGKVRPI